MDGKGDLAQKRAGLSPEKRALLEKRLRQKWRSEGPTQEIFPVTDHAPAPLSCIQERIWFLQQLQPDTPAFNRPVALKLKGPLSLTVLQQTLNEILNRHEVLRTIFPSQEGKPVQSRLADSTWPISVINLEGVPRLRRSAEAKKLVIEEAGRTFDLARGPLVRASLFRLDQEEHLLLLGMHHIAFDAWSANILIKEIAMLYEAFVSGRPAPLPELPIQYADFACWQRQMVKQKLGGQLSYWKEQLNGLPFLDLPTDHPRPTMQTYRGGKESFVLSSDLIESLKELSRQENVTLFMTLLAAFQTMLSRYTGKEDIVVGSLTTGRNWLETEGLIGCFINTLTMRTDLSGKPSFCQLLARVRKVCLEAYAHKDLPFEQLVEALQPERDLSRTPFFQVIFNLENFPEETFETRSVSLEELDFDWGTAPYDLILEVTNKNQTMHGSLVYNADLFEASTIRRMMGHFLTLLEGMVAHPETPISLLPILTPRERHQLLVEWNSTETNYPKDRCIHQLFEAQAERSPEAPAVSFGECSLTYAQLDARANQIAHYLKKQGVGPEVMVGICMEPSLELMVGMMGILKAGGCYVPLDTEYPKERIAFMLADTGAKVVLTQEKLKAVLPEGGIQAICLDTDNAVISQESTAKVSSATVPENLAGIFYTSGSTGKPKGVSINHIGINRLVLNTNYINFQPSDRVSQAANISFDGATLEIWGAFLNGGCLVIAPKDILVSPSDLATFIREQKISVMFLTPAIFNQVAQEVPDAFRSVRDLIMGGEVLEPRWVKKVMRHGPPARLINGYGPTECTTFATWYLVSDIPEEDRAIPIGRTISNTTSYILDHNLQPVPIGVTGELYLGGDGLARGYLNRPEQTAEKFIPNPFSDKPGARLYRTGDLARYLPDGNIDFLGRIDHQIKIRGFRVEPGEIEAALLGHAGVNEALVMMREIKENDKRLIAYVVPVPKSSLTSDTLRNFLRERLPVYMLPAFFAFLDNFPLNPNGKVDRKALSVLDVEQGVSEKVYVAPRDEIEQQLVKAWEAVLGVCPIGVEDDFFGLGGHSLLGAQLFTKIETIFDQKLPLSLLYQKSTIAQLSEVIRDQEWPAPAGCSLLVPINPSGSKPPFFWIQGKDGLPVMKRSLTAEQPLYYLQSPFEIYENLFIDCGIEEVAADYLKQIRQVQAQGPFFLGGFSLGGLLAFEIAWRLQEQGSEVGLLFLLCPTPPGGASPLIGLPVGQHYEKLRQLGSRERVNYLVKSMRNLSMKLTSRALGKFGLISEKIFPSTAYRLAIKNYNPGLYSGRTVLIQDRNIFKGNHFDWGRVITGSLEVHKFDVFHEELLKRPHIPMWVAYLQKYLEEAQAVNWK